MMRAAVFVLTFASIFTAIACRIPQQYYEYHRSDHHHHRHNYKIMAPELPSSSPSPLSLFSGSPSPAASSSGGSGCGDLIFDMLDCIPYLRDGNLNDTKPEGNCCSGFMNVINKQANCICYGLKNSRKFEVQVNMTRLTHLPSICGAGVSVHLTCDISHLVAGRTASQGLVAPESPLTKAPNRNPVPAPNSSFRKAPNSSPVAAAPNASLRNAPNSSPVTVESPFRKAPNLSPTGSFTKSPNPAGPVASMWPFIQSPNQNPPSSNLPFTKSPNPGPIALESPSIPGPRTSESPFTKSPNPGPVASASPFTEAPNPSPVHIMSPIATPKSSFAQVPYRADEEAQAPAPGPSSSATVAATSYLFLIFSAVFAVYLG